jgi:hypothetical protein
MHAMLLVLLPIFALLTRWQLGRALDGNTLSWAYTFEWPLFAGYAVYVWWQLIHDQARGVPGGRPASRPVARATTPDGAVATSGQAGPDPDEPGWALSGGRARNVAIAAAQPIDEVSGGRGERYRSQTAEEADELAAYNRYLADLNATDAAGDRS